MPSKNCLPDAPVRIASVGTAVPPCTLDQQMVFPLVKMHYGNVLAPRSLEVLQKVLAHKSIRHRHVAVDSIAQIAVIKTETVDNRMDRFAKWAIRLSAEAVRAALDRAGKTPQDIGALVVNTCTGYLCPGIGTYLVEELDLDRSTRIYDLVGAGCGGAIPTLQTGAAFARELMPGKVVACVSVEICSATFEMGDDMALLVSNAIFGDGAGAAILTCTPGAGPRIVDSWSRFHPEHRDDVRYVYKNGRLHNRLAPALPSITGSTVTAFVKELLAASNLTIDAIDAWVLHPGGEKILAALQAGLGLDDQAMALARGVLRDYGNMSSPTVLFELERLLDKENSGAADKKCLMVAFGAGMAIHGMLLDGNL